MSVDLVAPTAESVRRVADRMRQRDVDEIGACFWRGSRAELSDALTDAVMAVPDTAWVATSDGEPVAVVGVRPMWPTVWDGYMFATDEWPAVSLSVTRHVRRIILPMLRDAGARRLQCWSLDRHAVAHEWLGSLGFEKHSEHPQYGRDGETFFLFWWRPDVQELVRRRKG